MKTSIRRIALLAALLLPTARSGLAQTLTLKVAGASRTATLHVPTGTLTNPPLVFLLHGLGGDGPGMQSTTQMNPVADREKFIAVYPSAVGGTWDYAGAKNDYAFFQSIIDTTVARYQVDRNRVYVTGFSQGGGEAVYAAFSYPDVYAAVAPVSSVGSGAPTPKRPIPIFLTFGTSDLYTPATFMASVASWIKIDSCATTPTVVRPYPATNTKSVVTRLSYGNCAHGTEIVADSIQGGPHEWPNNTATKVNNAEEVWAFFKKFTLNRGATSLGDDFAASRPSVTASYRAGVVSLAGVDESCPVRVMDSRGAVVAASTAIHGEFAFPAKSRGVYVVEAGASGRMWSVRVVVP
jgi:poly(3-hydroxybutyrate) depolymerase